MKVTLKNGTTLEAVNMEESYTPGTPRALC